MKVQSIMLISATILADTLLQQEHQPISLIDDRNTANALIFDSAKTPNPLFYKLLFRGRES